MTIEQAKQILLPAVLAREADGDPQIAEALALADRDPALREWLEKQRVLQNAVRRNLRAISVPANLRKQILASRKIIQPLSWWKHPMLWSAAAMLMLLCGVGLWLSDAPDQNNLATFRGRMVGAVLRQYTMDIVTNDMNQVRAFLASKNAPADYTLPGKLASLPVSGGGILSWQGQKVSMVCLDSLKQGTLFLFMVDDSTLKEGTVGMREFEQVNKLSTVTWNTNGRTYVLAGSGAREDLEQYF